MSHFKFEGDISDISASQLEYISSVLEERGYKNEKISIEAVGQAGDNYVANVKRITVDKDGEKFSMVAKIAPDMEALRNAMSTGLMFQNEHIMYYEVLPKLTELERAAEIPENERLRYAACYGSNTEIPNEVILLEDLKISGYIMLDRFVSLTNDTVKLVLKNFAILHSLSYAMKNQEPETYAALKSKLGNIWSAQVNAPELKLYFQSIENEILQLLDEDKYVKVVKGIVSQLGTYALKCSKIDSQSKYSVIQQGDSWTNNIMFRLNEDKAVDCCMIDYQLSKESSPVADIQYMIFNCTDYETRSKHYYDWIDYYHTQLDKCLANYGLKANFIYPRDQLDADLKRHGKLSFCTAALLATVLIRESADAAKMKSTLGETTEATMLEDVINANKVTGLDEKTVLRFKTRVQGLLESFLELGYL